jgi:ABC-type branched-subunit amino acid transport system ATPase component
MGITPRLHWLRPLPRLRRYFLVRWIALLAEIPVALIRPPAARREEQQMESEVCNLLRLFGPHFLTRLDEPAYRLSCANRRRPKLLLLDEPTTGLSPKPVNQVLESMQQMNRDLDVAILMVEQNAELALSIAHRGYVLQNGVIKLSGSAAELLADANNREAHLGRSPGNVETDIPITL